ncbi:MAG: YHS domain-containing protein [Planctomycetota bacterium]|jgi:YHS domain-containing protein
MGTQLIRGLLVLALAAFILFPVSCSDEGGSPAAKKETEKEAGKSQDKAEKSEAAKGDLKPQQRCPVMGNPINKEVYVDYQGKRVYFCCPGCDAKFKKDPEKWLKKLAEMGEKPVDIPK